MSDRFCIYSDGKVQVTLSADDLLSCCANCGYGCEGGYPLDAWEYIEKNGIVTGGGYKSNVSLRITMSVPVWLSSLSVAAMQRK